MKHTNIKKLLSIALVAAVAATPLMAIAPNAEAAPRNNPRVEYRNDRNKTMRRNRNNKRRGDRWDRNRGNTEVFTGEVTWEGTAERFDIRVDGKVYNVFPIANRRTGIFKRGDIVRVRGWRYGANDIRDAEVTVLRRH